LLAARATDAAVVPIPGPRREVEAGANGSGRARALSAVGTRGFPEYLATAGGGDPAKGEVKEPGVLIGDWTDYTPSGALDIEVTIAPVLAAS
jgi:hypothetical protein